LAYLNRIAANQIDKPVGKITYTSLLNEQGGIVADLTIVRRAPNKFWVMTGGGVLPHDLAWLEKHAPDDVVITDVSSAWATIGLWGPKAREVLQRVCEQDISNEAFPYYTTKNLFIDAVPTYALRVSYAGELGWELYIPTEFMLGVYDEIISTGSHFGLVHSGYHALNSLRIEKAYRHWGHDITDEDSPLEAGLGFAVKLEKVGGFIGRDALVRQRQTGLRKRLVQLKLKDSQPLLYHNEPIWRDNGIVGFIRSGMYGHSLGAAVGLGYVSVPGAADRSIESNDYEIEIAGERIPAIASLRPLYDPRNERIRG